MNQNLLNDTPSQLLDGQIYIDAVQAPEASQCRKNDRDTAFLTHKKSAGEMTD